MSPFVSAFFIEKPFEIQICEPIIFGSCSCNFPENSIGPSGMGFSQVTITVPKGL